VIDFAAGLHTDQRWLDLAPAMFPDVSIQRGAGYNVAYWNIAHRTLSRGADGNMLVNGEPLRFFHFSGYDPLRVNELSKFQNRFRLTSLPLVAELAHRFAQRLEDCGRRRCSELGYRFARLSDATQIRSVWRELVRVNHPEVAGIEDPFDASWRPLFERLEFGGLMSRDDWTIQWLKRRLGLLGRVERRCGWGRLSRAWLP
jgi:hypothetical protein